MARFVLAILAACSLLRPAPADAEVVHIRTATLAPEGSTWMNHYLEMAEEVRERTEGRVEFVFYPGGVAGDEDLVVRKLRIGQIHAAMLSGVGLSEILAEVRILDIPFLFRNHEETDRVRALVQPRFDLALKGKGFVPLGWTDLGTLYMFSKHPLRSMEDLRRRRVWVWEGDTVAEATFRTCGVGPIPVAVPDVLTSLQSGLLDTVYVSPVASLALQWFTSVRTMTDLPLLDASCLLLVTGKQWEKIRPADQNTILDVNRRIAERLTREVRKADEESIRTLKSRGIEVIPPAEEARRELDRIAREVSQGLVGRLYSQDLLDDVLHALGDRGTSK